jgi:hypothetical protein
LGEIHPPARPRSALFSPGTLKVGNDKTRVSPFYLRRLSLSLVRLHKQSKEPVLTIVGILVVIILVLLVIYLLRRA